MKGHPEYVVNLFFLTSKAQILIYEIIHCLTTISQKICDINSYFLLKLSGFYQLELTPHRKTAISLTETDNILQSEHDGLVNLETKKIFFFTLSSQVASSGAGSGFFSTSFTSFTLSSFSGTSLYALSISLLSLSFESKSLNRFLDFFFFVTKCKWNLINHLPTLLLKTNVSPNNIKVEENSSHNLIIKY